MPAALDIDKEQVQMLVLTYGVRETARQLGLPESTVQAWSARGRWLADAPRSQPLPPTVVRPATVATKSPVNALQQAMRDDALNGRAAALRVTRRALERADKYDDDELMVQEVAQVINSYVKSASIAGGYSAADQVIKMNLNLTAQSQEGVTLDAEIVQPVDGEELP